MKLLKQAEWYKKLRIISKSLRTSKFAQNMPTRTLRKFIAQQIKKILFKRKLKKGAPIFVCQMGKVGSRSIVESLEKNYPGVVLHGHLISRMDWRAQNTLDWVNEGHPLKIISPVRDPISRNVSAFFHFIEGRIGHASDQSGLPVNELVDNFINSSYPNETDDNKKMMEHELPLEWFDNNIKKYFNIDVYSSPFPESGFITFSHANTELLVFRIDMNNESKEALIQDFLELPSFTLKNTNIGDSKGYSEKYKEFKNKAELPEHYLNKMCESKYFKHFYTAQEISSIRNRWLSKTIS